MPIMSCSVCAYPDTTLYYRVGSWYCKTCKPSDEETAPYFKETGRANPFDPKGSTAHIRDIKDRRWNPKEKRMFYYSKEQPKTYFFPKG